MIISTMGSCLRPAHYITRHFPYKNAYKPIFFRFLSHKRQSFQEKCALYFMYSVTLIIDQVLFFAFAARNVIAKIFFLLQELDEAMCFPSTTSFPNFITCIVN